MMKAGPFCNSDKYSFIIAFQQVFDHIPENLRNLMQRGEATMGEVPEDELDTPAFIRRAYLMDLYRFYRLFPSRNEFVNPFNTTSVDLGACEFFSLWLFKGSPLEPYKDQVVRLLKRKKMDEPAMRLLDSYSDDHRSIQYYIWNELYDQALELEPQNERALRGKARKLFESGLFDEAMDTYDELLLLHPDNATYLLNKAVCLVKTEDFEEALKLLYRLNYEQPDNDRVTRVLGWALLCNHQLEQADKIYQRLTAMENPMDDDWHNYAYCCWFSGRIDEAVNCFRKNAGPYEEDKSFPLFDYRLLEEYGISSTQIKLMEAAVLS